LEGYSRQPPRGKGAGDLGGVREHGMDRNRSTEEPGISQQFFARNGGVLADKCKSEEAETTAGKSDGT